MKPGIINIIYFVLAYLALSSGLSIYELFETNLENGYSALYNSSVSILIVGASLLGIYSLAVKLSWSKWVCFGVVASQSVLTLGSALYLCVLNFEIGKFMLITSVPFGLAFAFLAYKIYSSNPLKHFLTNA